MIRLHDTWDVILLAAIVVAVPAGIFHYMGGRYGQVIIAIIAVTAGLWMLHRSAGIEEQPSEEPR
jgi:hypothetical protein